MGHARDAPHGLAAEDVRWLVGLLGPVVARKYDAAARRAGLDPALCERILAAIPAVLADGGPLVRAELIDALIARGWASTRGTRRRRTS